MSPPGRLRNAALLGGGTLVAALFGLVFQSLLAYHFGAGAETDAWFMSLSIFGFLGKFLMLTHLKSIALPVYRALGQDDPAQAGRFGGLLLAWTVGVLAALSALLVLAAPVLVDVLAPGYEGAMRDLTIRLVAIRVPALVFLGATTAGLVVLESGHRFGVTVSAQKIVPAALTLTLFLLAADRWGMVGVGWMGLAGAAAGGVVALVAVLRRLPGLASPGAADPALRKVAGTWLTFGGSNAATFVGEWAFRVAASLLPVGLFSAVLYGRMVHDLLHGAVNDAAQTVSLPRFAQAGEEPGAAAAGSAGSARVGDQLRDSLASLSALNVPLAAFVAATAPWTVAVLFGRGRFLEDGMVGPAAVALQIFAAGFLLQGLNQLVFAAAFASNRSHLVNRVQIAGHLARAAALVPAVLAFSYVGLVAAQVAMNALVLALLLALAPREWRLGGRAFAAVVSGPGRGVLLATLVPLGLFAAASRALPEPAAVGTPARLAVLALAAAAWGVLYVAVAHVLDVPAVRRGVRRVGRWGVGVGVPLLFVAAAPGAASAQAAPAAPADSAEGAPAVGSGLLPSDHWSRAVLEALEARGRLPAGVARAGPLDGSLVEALLTAASADPVARAARTRLRQEAGTGPGTGPGAGTFDLGYRHVRDGAPGASGALAGARLRLGRPGGRVFATVDAELASGGGSRLVAGSAGVRLGRVALQAGRHRIQLGGGAAGGFTVSAGAGLDGLLLSTVDPPDLPVVGRGTLTAGLFRMGAYADVVDDPWFALLRLAAAPAPWLQVGVSRAALVGGRFEGGPPPFDPVPIPADERGLGLGDVLDILVGRVTAFDDQVWAFDLRGSLAPLGVPATVYGEVALEDDERSFGDGALLAGLLLDAGLRDALVTFRYEYAGVGDPGRWCAWCDTLPAFWYQHTRFQDGWRVGDELLGHPLGGYGLQHAVAVVAADRDQAVRAEVTGARLRRDRWNLLERTRPGWAWGLRSSVRVRAGPRLEAGAATDLEWGDGGWRAGSARVWLAVIPGAAGASRR